MEARRGVSGLRCGKHWIRFECSFWCISGGCVALHRARLIPFAPPFCSAPLLTLPTAVLLKDPGVL